VSNLKTTQPQTTQPSQVLCVRVQDLPFVEQLEAPMRAAREKLQFRLAAALKATLVDRHASARHHCLLSFASISDLAGAEQATSYPAALLPDVAHGLCLRPKRFFLQHPPPPSCAIPRYSGLSRRLDLALWA